MKLVPIACVIFFMLAATKVCSQVNPNLCFVKELIQHDSSNYIFHKINNGYPDTVNVIGQIVGVRNPICGFLCIGGSMKVKLTKKIDGYPFEYIYIATGCAELWKKCQADINITATKLMKLKKTPCTLESVRNQYDSNEIPFYVITDRDSKKLQE